MIIWHVTFRHIKAIRRTATYIIKRINHAPLTFSSNSFAVSFSFMIEAFKDTWWLLRPEMACRSPLTLASTSWTRGISLSLDSLCSAISAFNYKADDKWHTDARKFNIQTKYYTHTDTCEILASNSCRFSSRRFSSSTNGVKAFILVSLKHIEWNNNVTKRKSSLDWLEKQLPWAICPLYVT